MVETAAGHGYGGASVARVIECAGIPRATFYAHFASREDCFLAAYRAVVSRLRLAVGAATRSTDSRDVLRAALKALLDELAADPSAGRLVFFEALAAPAQVRAEHERLIEEVESAIDGVLVCEGGGERSLQISSSALLWGVCGVAAARLLRGEAAALPSLRRDLFDWIDAYRLPAGRRPEARTNWDELGRRFPPVPRKEQNRPRLLPRGRSALPPDLVATERHARIVEATIKVTAGRGYSAVTVPQIASAARVTKAAFYTHFKSKQEAFLAAQRRGLQESLAASAGAFYVSGSWAERVWAALGMFLRYIGENPEAAYLGVVEFNAAGEAAIQLEHDTRMAYTLFLEDGYRERLEVGPPLRPLCSEAIAGANYGLLRRLILREGAERAPQLQPHQTYVTLAPFLGPERAMSFIEEQLAGVP
jgi:AcrR family transcriptional regulator